MNELDVFRLLLARRDNYSISEIAHISGRAYSLVMNGRTYNAVILPSSFDFYERRYHITKHIPDLVICFQHDTVLAVSCLSLKSGRIAEPYDLPGGYVDVERQRHRSKIGSQCLLGMYLCGMRDAQKLVNSFKPTTRKRYVERARELSKRRPGRPVDTIAS
ncbi:MAG: hypothetical protein ACJ788_19725 [Ktedonobacteraceae bacterium]